MIKCISFSQTELVTGSTSSPPNHARRYDYWESCKWWKVGNFRSFECNDINLQCPCHTSRTSVNWMSPRRSTIKRITCFGHEPPEKRCWPKTDRIYSPQRILQFMKLLIVLLNNFYFKNTKTIYLYLIPYLFVIYQSPIYFNSQQVDVYIVIVSVLGNRIS